LGLACTLFDHATERSSASEHRAAETAAEEQL